MKDEQKLLKRSEILMSHIWNMVINGGKFTDDDLKSMEELGTDIRDYFNKPKINKKDMSRLSEMLSEEDIDHICYGEPPF